MHFDRALHMASYCSQDMDPVVNQSVFCTDLRFEYGERTIAVLSPAS